MILEAYFKLWRGWSKTQGQKVISDTSLPQKLKDNNLHKSGKCRPMWPKISPNDQIGLAMGALHWREHNIWLNEWQKNHFCFLYKNPTQRCSRRQLDYREATLLRWWRSRYGKEITSGHDLTKSKGFTETYKVPV